MNNLKMPTFEPMTPVWRCPCCGGSATVKLVTNKPFLRKMRVYHYVQCDICGLHTRLADTKKSAVTQWNRRADNI